MVRIGEMLCVNLLQTYRIAYTLLKYTKKFRNTKGFATF